MTASAKTDTTLRDRIVLGSTGGVSAERTRGEQVSAAVDQINARFGDGAITYGINAPHPGFFERG